jgi:hypothetical protein
MSRDVFIWLIGEALVFYWCIRLITLIYGGKRCCVLLCTSKYDRFTARISVERTGVLRRIRTAIYGRNTVPTKRVSHGPFTVIIITYTNVFVRVNDGKPSFAIVVTLDLGKELVHIVMMVD